MGQKVSPHGIRLGIVKPWSSTWYANTKDFSKNLANDFKVREFIKKELANAAVSRVGIERSNQNKSIKVTIFSARPGIIIGKGGEDIEKLRKQILAVSGCEQCQVNISEIKQADLDAKLVAESIAQQLERRVMFRRAAKRAIQNAMSQGAIGVRVQVSGRLGGAEIARAEWFREGRVPLQTLRADIDYNIARANTTYGVIGVKVWIFKGEILGGFEEVLASQNAKPESRKKPNNNNRKAPRRNQGRK